MKIMIEPGSVTAEQLKADLKENFPYTQYNRSATVFFIGKSGTIGAGIVVKKDKILVNANFPTMPGQMLFTFTLIFTGILIPLIVYFSVFHKDQKAFEKEIGDWIQAEYGKK